MLPPSKYYTSRPSAAEGLARVFASKCCASRPGAAKGLARGIASKTTPPSRAPQKVPMPRIASPQFQLGTTRYRWKVWHEHWPLCFHVQVPIGRIAPPQFQLETTRCRKKLCHKHRPLGFHVRETTSTILDARKHIPRN